MSSTLLAKYATYEEELMGHEDTVVAFAGGGQGSATQITKKWIRVGTCATDLDSVKLPIGGVGKKCVVTNGTSKYLAVYPTSNEYMNLVLNDYYIVPPGSSAIFECLSSYLNTPLWSSYIIDQTSTQLKTFKTSLSSANILALHATPIVCVPAVTNYFIEWISGSLAYTKGSTPYASGATPVMMIDTATSPSAYVSTDFTSGSSFHIDFYKPSSGQKIISKGLTITNGTGNYVNGNGTAIVYGCYRLHKA